MTTATSNEEFLTVGQVSQLLGGRTRRTLANWRSARTGPAYIRAGRTILYRRSSFEAWLVSQEQACAKPKGDKKRK